MLHSNPCLLYPKIMFIVLWILWLHLHLLHQQFFQEHPKFLKISWNVDLLSP